MPNSLYCCIDMHSNWRGPIWMAVNFLLVESLLRFYMFYGKSLQIECPTGSGNYMHLGHVAEEIQHVSIPESLQRPVLPSPSTKSRTSPMTSSSCTQSNTDFLNKRLQHLFSQGDDGRRAINNGNDMLDFDPHWKDYLSFHEFFDGDTGAGMSVCGLQFPCFCRSSREVNPTILQSLLLHMFCNTQSIWERRC